MSSKSILIILTYTVSKLVRSQCIMNRKHQKKQKKTKKNKKKTDLGLWFFLNFNLWVRELACTSPKVGVTFQGSLHNYRAIQSM